MNREAARTIRHVILFAYIPVCCTLAGWIAVRSGFGIPFQSQASAVEVFWHYALPWPDCFSVHHLPTLAIGFLCLWLLELSAGCPRPIITRFQVQTIIIALILLVRIYFILFTITMPVGYRGGISIEGQLIYMQITYLNVDLLLVGLLTFLPVYRDVPFHWLGGVSRTRESARTAFDPGRGRGKSAEND